MVREREEGEEKEETANWGAGNRVKEHVQIAEEPLSIPNNILYEYIICLAETK